MHLRCTVIENVWSMLGTMSHLCSFEPLMQGEITIGLPSLVTPPELSKHVLVPESTGGCVVGDAAIAADVQLRTPANTLARPIDPNALFLKRLTIRASGRSGRGTPSHALFAKTAELILERLPYMERVLLGR
jgi:hypothetical protein